MAAIDSIIKTFSLANLKRERELALDAKREPSQFLRVTAQGGENAYRMALMGFDFESQAQLQDFRSRFASHDKRYENMNHAWDFAATDKDFFIKWFGDSKWHAVMDLRSNSPSQLLFKKFKQMKAYQFQSKRELTPAEKRVNFQAIERIFDEDAVDVDLKIRKIIEIAEKTVIDMLEQRGSDALSGEFAMSLRIDVGQEVINLVKEYLINVWRKNRDLAIGELPSERREKLEDLRRFANSKQYASAFKPDVAENYFANRSNMIKALLDETLQIQIRQEIFEHLKGGRTLNETIGNVKSIFEPYVGDPSKIAPSGPGFPASENILSAHRLENIIRTETSTAMSQGRAVVADASGGYVIGYELSAILDFRTSEVCSVADGKKFRKEHRLAVKLLPPLNFNCRTVPVFITQDDVPVKWSTEAQLEKVVRLQPKGFK